MKTLFANNEAKYFNNFSSDVLTSAELSLIKGGKEADIYIDPAKRLVTLTFSFGKSIAEKKDSLVIFA